MQTAAQNLIIVEDEPLIALMIEDVVQDLGWTVDGSAHTEAAAFNLLEVARPKLALLDINLGSATSLAVAASCRERRIPVVFMTGYNAKDIPPECGNAPVVIKPFTPDELEQAVKRAMTTETA